MKRISGEYDINIYYYNILWRENEYHVNPKNKIKHSNGLKNIRSSTILLHYTM